jgi:hypothetical protein
LPSIHWDARRTFPVKLSQQKLSRYSPKSSLNPPASAKPAKFIKDTSNNYLFYVFNNEIQQLKAKAYGSKFDAITIKTFDEVKNPLPLLDIQQQIVTECAAVDAEASTAQATMESANKSTTERIYAMLASSHPSKALQNICEIKRGRFSHRPRNDPRFFGVNYPFIQTGDVVRAVATKRHILKRLMKKGWPSVNYSSLLSF